MVTDGNLKINQSIIHRLCFRMSASGAIRSEDKLSAVDLAGHRDLKMWSRLTSHCLVDIPEFRLIIQWKVMKLNLKDIKNGQINDKMNVWINIQTNI